MNFKTRHWTGFFSDIQRSSTEVFVEYLYQLAVSIDILINLIADHKTHNHYRILAGTILGKIGGGNKQVITILVQILIDPSRSFFSCKQAAEILGQIGFESEEAITALSQTLISSYTDKDTRWQAAVNLEKIGAGSERAIDALCQILTAPYADKDTRWQAVVSLGKIGAGNERVIDALCQILTAPYADKDTRWQAAVSLGKIGAGNERAINYLCQILTAPYADKDTRWQAAVSLGKIGAGNERAINYLLHLSSNIRIGLDLNIELIEILGKIGFQNTNCINYLFALMIDFDLDWQIRRKCAETLGKIANTDENVVNLLLQILQQSDSDWDLNWLVVQGLSKIQAIKVETYILEILNNKNLDKYTYRLALWNLGNLRTKDNKVLDFLSEVATTHVLEEVRQYAYKIIKKIQTFDSHEAVELPGNSPEIDEMISTEKQASNQRLEYKQMMGVVPHLKAYLSNEFYEQDFDQFDESYKLLWNCAENLSYPDFYQAWHHPPTTPHPEVTEQTPNRGEQTFAPPLTCESLQHLPIYCLNADLLANETREGEIALTLSELIWEINCPDEDPPEPATPAELRRHLKTLKRRNLLPHRAILFGGERFSTPTKPTPELIVFCQKLTAVIAIAFLTDESLEAPLKGFPPNQPNLISAIETWLEEI